MTEDKKVGRPSNDARLRDIENRLVGYEGKIANIMEALASLRRDVAQHDELRMSRGEVIHTIQEGLDKITKAYTKRFGGDLSPICPNCRKRVLSTAETCPNCEVRLDAS
jgi:hypothetical protein